MKKRDFLTVSDLGAEELRVLLDRAAELKRDQEGHAHPLRGRSVGMLFDKSSTRTRVSFEVGIYQLGGNSIYMVEEDIKLGVREPIKDIAKVHSRYFDGIVARTFSHKDCVSLGKYSTTHF